MKTIKEYLIEGNFFSNLGIGKFCETKKLKQCNIRYSVIEASVRVDGLQEYNLLDEKQVNEYYRNTPKNSYWEHEFLYRFAFLVEGFSADISMRLFPNDRNYKIEINSIKNDFEDDEDILAELLEYDIIDFFIDDMSDKCGFFVEKVCKIYSDDISFAILKEL